MNIILEEIFKTGYVKTAEGKLCKVHSTISREEGLFLQELINECKPKQTLEVGLGYGISSLFICEALEKTPTTKHIVIDPNQFEDPKGYPFEGIGLINLKKAGFFDLIEFHNEVSYLVLPKLIKESRVLDFAFIDGWHTFDYALVDFFLIDKLLKVGGLLVIDDADWQSIRKLCRYIVTNHAYSVFRCLGNERISIKRRILVNFVKYSHFLNNKLRFLKPEILISDSQLGLRGSCIAFQKKAVDNRRWDFHSNF